TDKTNITRKPSKMGKHGHGKRKSTREAKDSKPKPEKVKLQSNGQTSVKEIENGAKNHCYYSSVVSNLPRVKSRGFLQLRVKMENSSDQEQDGKDKSVKSSSLIGSLMPRGLKEAQEMMIFALDHSHNKHKGHIKDCQLGNPCEL
ncbi:hypothetical protein Tco_0505625, partial [Tanacetum coccineum]